MPFYSEWLKRLSNFEVSPNLIWIAGISFLVAFVFLLREFFSWMVKQNEISGEIKKLRQEIEQLNGLISRSHNPSVEYSVPQNPSFPLLLKRDHENSLEN